MKPWHPPHPAGPTHVVTLTRRRAEILDGLCRGLSNVEIGRELYVSPDTVKTHVKYLYAASGANNRTHLVHLIYTGQVRALEKDTEPWRKAAS